MLAGNASCEPLALEKVREGLRMARAGLNRYEKKGDPTDKEVSLRIYYEVAAFVEEAEMKLGLVHNPDPDD